MALADALGKVQGVEVLNDTFFNEFTIRVPGNAAEVIEKLGAEGRAGRRAGVAPGAGPAGARDLIVVAATEINTDADRAAYVAALKRC